MSLGKLLMTANIEKRQRGIAGLQMKEHKNNPRQPKKKKGKFIRFPFLNNKITKRNTKSRETC